MQDILWPKAEYQALMALWRGSGDEGTNRRAIKFLVEVVGRVNGQSFVPGSPDETNFNEGRRWVARQIQNALTLPEKTIVQQETVNAGDSSSNDRSAVQSTARKYIERTRDRQRVARNAVEPTD